MGEPEIKEGKIDLPLAKVESGKDSRMEHVDVDEDRGKKAVSRYLVLESLAGRISWVELEPITGRTHQLRVHCAENGWPIVGDAIYGGAARDGDLILQLLSRIVTVPLYKNRDAVTVTAPVPLHMREGLAACGWIDNDPPTETLRLQAG